MVTSALEPLKLRALPYLPEVVQDALCSVPTFPLPDRSATVVPEPSCEGIGGHQVRRRRRRRGPRGRGGNTRVGAHLGSRVPRPQPIRVARRRHQPRVRQRRGRRRRHLHRTPSSRPPDSAPPRTTRPRSRPSPPSTTDSPHPTPTPQRPDSVGADGGSPPRWRHRRCHTRIRTKIPRRVPRPHPIAERRPRRSARIAPNVNPDTVVTAAKLEQPAP